MTEAIAASAAPVVAPAVAATAAPSVAAPVAAPAATASAPASFDWNSAGLDPDTLNLVNDRKWASPKDVLQSYRNLEKLTGVPADKIIKLPTDADPAAWNDVYTKLGKPDVADKYDIPVPQGDAGTLMKEAKNWFHEANLSVSQGKALAEKWNAFVESQSKAQETQHQTAMQADINKLKQEWGSGYEANAAVVDRAAMAFGLDQDTVSALRDVLGPAKAMKFLHAVGSKIAMPENGLINGQIAPGFSSMSPAAAQAKINELRTSKTFAQQFVSPDPKVRSEARDQMTRLHQIAFPQQSS